MAKISIIACVQQDRGIGYDGKLIWHIPLDMAIFKHLTKDHKCIMGRNTFDSLPEPLVKRENIILTRDKIDLPNCTAYHDMEDLEKYLDTLDEEVWVIGGARMYEHFLPKAERVVLTRVSENKPADTFFPEFHPEEGDWDIYSRASYNFDNIHAETLEYVKKQVDTKAES